MSALMRLKALCAASLIGVTVLGANPVLAEDKEKAEPELSAASRAINKVHPSMLHLPDPTVESGQGRMQEMIEGIFGLANLQESDPGFDAPDVVALRDYLTDAGFSDKLDAPDVLLIFCDEGEFRIEDGKGATLIDGTWEVFTEGDRLLGLVHSFDGRAMSRSMGGYEMQIFGDFNEVGMEMSSGTFGEERFQTMFRYPGACDPSADDAPGTIEVMPSSVAPETAPAAMASVVPAAEAPTSQAGFCSASETLLKFGTSLPSDQLTVSFGVDGGCDPLQPSSERGQKIGAVKVALNDAPSIEIPPRCIPSERVDLNRVIVEEAAAARGGIDRLSLLLPGMSGVRYAISLGPEISCR